MSRLPPASLPHILEKLSTILEVACGAVGLVDAVGDVIVLDPLVEPLLPGNALVLGIGLHDAGDVTRVVAQVGKQKAAGLVVRAPMVPNGPVIEASERWMVPVLTLSRGVTWLQLAARIRSIISESRFEYADSSTLGGIRSGDLMGVAHALGVLLGAPVAIEDRDSHLLAFSTPPDDSSGATPESTLNDHVSRRFLGSPERHRALQEIHRSHQPVFVSAPQRRGRGAGADADGVISESSGTAIAVRAGDEILGTVWVSAAEPLDEDRSQALYDASRLVAMHLMWHRADTSAERRLRSDRIRTALESGVGSRDAVRLLGLRGESVVVLALDLADSSDRLRAQMTAERMRLADAFAMHLSAAHHRSVAGLVGEVIYAILPVSRHGERSDEHAVRVATDFLARMRPQPRGLIGVGPTVADTSELAHSRAGADRALRVLRASPAADQVARLEDLHTEALLLEFSDRLSDTEIPAGPLARLLTYDAGHESNLVETLRAWLDAFGDIPAAAAGLGVHPNTFRYRLRRAAEVGGLDLEDPRARFGAMLQLRLLAVRSAD